MKHSKELEAVARALWAEYQLDRSAVFKISPIAWDAMDMTNEGYIQERQRFFNMARAALTAIREPTEGMVVAAWNGSESVTKSNPNAMECAVRAAIDYALRDTTGEG